MIIWTLMLVPVLATLVLFLFFDIKKVAWWEYLLLYASAAIVIIVSKFIIETYAVYDTEYWSEKALEVEYEGAYDEYIHRTCTRSYPCGTNSNGSTRYCQTTYDCSYVHHHSPSYRIKGGNFSIKISKSEYDRIKKKWGNEKKTGTHRNSYSYDNGIYSSYWNGDTNLIECIVTEHSYENRVQASNNIFKFQDVTDDDILNYELFDYPKIYQRYKQNHILGFNDEKAENKTQILNAILGPKKEVKVFILIFKNQPIQAGIMQEAYWKGGNKNEFVLTIGLDHNNKVMWSHPFTWAEHSIVKINTRDFVLEQDEINLSYIVDFLYNELDNNFVRKHFSEFSYITIQPSNSSMLISTIILIIITGFLVVWIVSNEFDDELLIKKPNSYGVKLGSKIKKFFK